MSEQVEEGVSVMVGVGDHVGVSVGDDGHVIFVKTALKPVLSQEQTPSPQPTEKSTVSPTLTCSVEANVNSGPL